MKTLVKITLMLFVIHGFQSCSKDDTPPPTPPVVQQMPEPEPEPENNAPNAFDLVAVTDNAVEVDVLPTFSWNAATDPDGDTVTYNLYLNTGTEANQLYAENLTQNTFELTERLGLLENYTWRVEAQDANGAYVSSSTRSFSTRAVRFSDDPISENTEFGKRYAHSSVVFDNKLWVIGGLDENQNRKNDVWFSDDGITWLEAINEAPFTPREGHTSVVFDNKIWVLGGFSSGGLGIQSDVWSSSDGIVWEQSIANVPFGGRLLHSSVVFDDKIWVIGGLGESFEEKNDVWFSSDGITWSQANSNAPFNPRHQFSAVSFDNKIWVIGGFSDNSDNQEYKNDVWSSTDGITWKEEVSEAQFSVRLGHSSVVFDEKIWLVGGFIGNGVSLKDVWFSSDGSEWVEATDSTPFTARSAHTAQVFDSKVWLIGGFGDGDAKSDIWTFD